MEIKPQHPTHAVRMRDNWDGEGDAITLFAFKKEDVFYSYDSGDPVLQYQGDEILKVWPLN